MSPCKRNVWIEKILAKKTIIKYNTNKESRNIIQKNVQADNLLSLTRSRPKKLDIKKSIWCVIYIYYHKIELHAKFILSLEVSGNDNTIPSHLKNNCLDYEDKTQQLSSAVL